MPEIVFTCTCKCAFSRWKRDDEAWEHACPLCGTMTTDCVGVENGKWRPSHLRLPGDQYDYISPIDGKHISSKHAHRDHLKRHNVVELGNDKPKLGEFKPDIPRENIRAEIKDNVERMKSHGTWRER